jgi:hypothetical protein
LMPNDGAIFNALFLGGGLVSSTAYDKTGRI